MYIIRTSSVCYKWTCPFHLGALNSPRQKRVLSQSLPHPFSLEARENVDGTTPCGSGLAGLAFLPAVLSGVPAIRRPTTSSTDRPPDECQDQRFASKVPCRVARRRPLFFLPSALSVKNAFLVIFYRV
jgi:hypothetical protein